MNMSSNELQMAVLKACRGIGLPVAQAQDVAAAIAISPWALKQLLSHLAQPTTPARFEFSAGVDVKNASILRDFSTCAHPCQYLLYMLLLGHKCPTGLYRWQFLHHPLFRRHQYQGLLDLFRKYLLHHHLKFHHHQCLD